LADRTTVKIKYHLGTFAKQGRLTLLHEEDIQILNRAGLTVFQAKIYLAFALYGKQTIKSVAKTADIDRSNVYREISKLQELALLRKIMGTPNTYQAIPLQDAISVLLASRKREFEEMKKETKKLLRKTNDLQDYSMLEDEKLTVVPKSNAFIKSAMQNIKNIQTSNDTISSLKRFTQAMIYTFEIHRAALERGVTTRLIIEKPEEEMQLIKPVKTLMTYPNFQVKCTPNPPEVLGACFDNRKVSILLSPLADVEASPCFLTDHHSFVVLFHEYFESLWASAETVQNPSCQKAKTT
jgi:sugar-specific transcriptional regulator TrmB